MRYWANKALAKGRKIPKTNLLRRFQTFVTETESTTRIPAYAGNFGYGGAAVQIPEDDDIRYVDSMTLSDQSLREVRQLNTSLTKPKETVNSGCWNVRTLYIIGKPAQLAKEMHTYNIDILGISECQWTGHGKVRLSTGESSLIFRKRRQLAQTWSGHHDVQKSREITIGMETFQR